MTKHEADFIGSMNMCDEISNEAYKKIMCHCEVEEENFEDCISRTETLKHSHIEYDDDGEGHRVVYCEDIEQMPSVQPKRKKGKWIKLYKGDTNEHCFKCGFEARKKYNFCPECGADMREVNADEDSD